MLHSVWWAYEHLYKLRTTVNCKYVAVVRNQTNPLKRVVQFIPKKLTNKFLAVEILSVIKLLQGCPGIGL